MAPKKKASRPKQLGRLATAAAPGGSPDPEEPEQQATSSTRGTSLVPAGPPVLDLSIASVGELCDCPGYVQALQTRLPVLLRNPACWVNGWSDVFDLEALAGQGWWLSPIPGQAASPLDVDHTQLPTMTARLRAAKAAAAEGSRLGLIKAVALSLDAAGPGPKGWTQKHLALNAINKLLFRRKHWTDTYAPTQAAAEFEKLPAAERRLFHQVHAAMNTLDDAEPYSPAVQVNYTTSIMYRGMEQAWYSMSTRDMRHTMLNPHSHRGSFENVEAFFVGTGDNRLLPHISISAAYCYLLACYTLKGPGHADTLSALRQARNRDPHAWVPKLMAGLAYPPVSFSPVVAAGSRQEAWSYVRGSWATWCRGLAAEEDGIIYLQDGSPLQWLLQRCQLPAVTDEQQKKLEHLWSVTCYAPEHAFHRVEPLALEVQRVFNTTSGPGRIESMRQLGGVGALRKLVVLLCAMAQLTYNLPPMDVAPALWQEVVERVRWPTLDGARRRVHMCAMALLPVAQHLLRMYEGMPPHQLAEAGAVHAGEVEEIAALLGSLQPSAARWLWQVGDVRAAKQAAVDALAAWNQPKPVTMQWSASHETPRTGSGAASSSSGLQYAYSWQSIVDFVSAETVAALRGGRLKQRRGGSSGGSSSSQGLFATGAADPVYSLPGEWLDDLVGLLSGRRAKLCFTMLSTSCVDKEGMFENDADGVKAATYADSKGRVEVTLQGSDGRRMPFCWGKDGDANEANLDEQLMPSFSDDEEEDDEEGEEEGDWWEGDSEEEGDGPRNKRQCLSTQGASLGNMLAQELDDVLNRIFNPSSSSLPGGSAGAAAPAAAAAAAAGSSPSAAATAAPAKAVARPATAAVPAAAPAAARSAPAPAAAAAAASAPTAGVAGGAAAALADGGVALDAASTRGTALETGSSKGEGSGASSRHQAPPAKGSSAAAVEAAAGGQQQPAAQQSTAQKPAPGAAKGLKPCAWCGTQQPKLQKCSRCRKVGYCSKEHQLAHWPTHKQDCAAAAQ